MEPKDVADVWRERILAQRTSGQSIRAWCSANGCHEHSFYMWRLRLKLRPVGRGSSPPAVSGPARPITFAEVIANAPEAIRLRLSGGRELLLPASMAVEDLARLIRAIEGMP